MTTSRAVGRLDCCRRARKDPACGCGLPRGSFPWRKSSGGAGADRCQTSRGVWRWMLQLPAGSGGRRSRASLSSLPSADTFTLTKKMRFLVLSCTLLLPLALCGPVADAPPPIYKPTPAQPVNPPAYRPAPAPTYKPAPKPAYKSAPSPASSYRPAPAPAYRPAPGPAYRPAPRPSYQDPYAGNAPVALCPHYPYCNDAPHNIYHLQDEINALRQRNQLIVAAGEKLARQEPNRPFVGGYQKL